MFASYLFHQTKYFIAFAALFWYANEAKVCAPKENSTIRQSWIVETAAVVPSKKTPETNPCFAGVKPGKLTKKERAFILSITDGATLEEKYRLLRLIYKAYLTLTKNTVLSECFTAQFVLESGYGSTITGRFNYGGIKEFDPAKPRTLCRTVEMNCATSEINAYKARKHYYGRAYVGGSTVYYVSDYFKDFKSLRAYLRYKNALIKSGASYKANGCAGAETVGDYCECIVKAGYATDPNYGEKIQAVLEFWNNYSIKK